MPQLIKKIIIKGVICAESGIMVGGSSSAVEIGGTDKQVIRNPLTKLPFIPGSSLKGKMRSLLELVMGQVNEDNGNFGPTHNPNHISAQIFGHIKNKQNENKSQQPSRLIVRDAELLNADKFKDTELLYTEVKAENTIDRITSAANPRFFERVPKGAEFNLNMILNVFDIDAKGGEFLAHVFNAMRLVQDDYVGGSGSRGNGQISFKIDSIKERSSAFYQNKNEQSAQEKDIEIPKDFRYE
jgi:CRISPR-associated protein Csm3